MPSEHDFLTTNRIKKQFLVNVPVKEIKFENLVNNPDLQEQILSETVSSEAVLHYPVKLNYQKSFLGSLIKFLEQKESVIHDQVYEEYCRLVALPSTETASYKHYLINNGAKVILKENINLISEGTTGLRTWQASLALCEWIVQNPGVFENQVILELGSGVGLTGLTICKYCSANGVYFSDCHRSVLTSLCDNIKRNITSDFKDNNNIDEDSGIFNGPISNRCLLKEQIRDDSCAVQVLNLPWEEIDHEMCQKLGHIDIIVASDVVYDPEIFMPLIKAVGCFFNQGLKQFILSCTERNKNTLDTFFCMLNRHLKVNVEELVVPEQKNFQWDMNCPVKMFNIKSL